MLNSAENQIDMQSIILKTAKLLSNKIKYHTDNYQCPA